MPGDLDVFVGIYSNELGIYLRFYVDWDDDEIEIIGRFDVTFPNEIAERFRLEVVSACGLEIIQADPDDYYKSIIL